VRLLLADSPVIDAPALGSRLEDEDLVHLYAVPRTSQRWLRANFATSVDGGATGGDGRSGSVNTVADHVVFGVLRGLSDVVVIGAGTARDEGYGPLSVDRRWLAARAAEGLANELPLVVVSDRGHVPPQLVGARDGSVLLATHFGADGLDSTTQALGKDHVLVCGEFHVEPERLMDQLAERGWRRVLTEGGPRLFGSFLEAGVVDELCLSVTPRILAGSGPRIAATAGRDDAFVPRLLVEEDGTLMGRWLRTPAR